MPNCTNKCAKRENKAQRGQGQKGTESLWFQVFAVILKVRYRLRVKNSAKGSLFPAVFKTILNWAINCPKEVYENDPCNGINSAHGLFGLCL